MNTIKIETGIRLKKGQKCFKCKKVIKGAWMYNGHYWCEKCKDKDTAGRIRRFLKEIKSKTKGDNQP